MEVRRAKRATMDQFRVKRDGEGKIIPQEADTSFGTVLAVPMTYGDAELMSERSKEEGGLNAQVVAEYLSKHIADPDMSSLDGDTVTNELKAVSVKELLSAVMEVSGLKGEMEIEVGEDGTTKVALKND